MANEPQKSGIDKNTLIALALCAAIWFGWQSYLEKKYPEAMHPTSPAATATAGGTNGTASDNKITPDQTSITTGRPGGAKENPTISENGAQKLPPAGPENFWKYEDSLWRVEVSSLGGRISEIALKKYDDRDGNPVMLIKKDSPGFLVTHLGDNDTSAARINYKIKPVSETQVELDGLDGQRQIKKVFSLNPDKYSVDVTTEVSGQTADVRDVSFDVTAPAPVAAPSQGFGSVFSNLFSGGATTGAPVNHRVREGEIQEYFVSYGSKTERTAATEKDRPDKTYEQAHFAALGSRYFTTLFFNRGDVMPVAKVRPDGDFSLLRLSYPVLSTNGPITTRFSLYAGPKLMEDLQKVDEAAGQVMDVGRFSWIAIPILKLMKLLYDLFKNWGFAIIALTILVRLVTYPFTYMSYKSMKAMQRIQPETQKLREKYKDNPTLMNQEMMRLWKENKVNPMGGCLPILLQLPVFWALYSVLQNSIELYHAPFIFWIKDLSLKDPYYVTPVLMGITMFIQQKMTPSTADPAQARMMSIMPVFFALLMMNLPSGLTLYIFVSTLFGIIQQYSVMRDKRSSMAVVNAPAR